MENNPVKTQTAEESIVIERIFDAPPALVWKAWTDPEHFMRWWGPQHFTSPVCQMDLRVGGKYLYCMESPDGQRYFSTGIYQEVIPNQRLVYTDNFADADGNIVPMSYYNMGDDTIHDMRIIITLEDVDGKTKMTMTQIAAPTTDSHATSDMAIMGWNQSFDKLAETLR